ncbi:FHA domain-containing protein [Myxococcota bacterium]|nr:FHA domain-containing protein [Myxococcota bacterium]
MFQLFRIEDNRVTGQIRLLKSIYRLGRDRKNDVRFSSIRVSRFHAQLTWEGAGFQIRDLESANHTRVNGREITDAALRSGDYIDLGAGASLLYLEEESGARLNLSDLNGEQTYISLHHALHSNAALKEIIGALLDEIMALMKAQRGFIALVQDGRLQIKEGVARNLELIDEVKLAESIILEALKSGEVQIIDNSLATHSMIDLSLSQVICGPLTLHGEARGLIYLDTQFQPQIPSERRLSLFKMLCDQAIIAIENNRMYTDLLAMTQAQETLVREKQRRLEIKDEMFRVLSEHSAQGIFLVREGRLTYCNRAFEAMVGGRQLSALLRWGAGRYEAALREALGLSGVTLAARRVALSCLEPAPQHLEVHTQPLPAHLNGVQGFIIDVTQQRLLHDQLLGAQRMEAVARLASGLAHDFNNLLTVIRGGVDLLALEAEDPTDKIFADIRGACQHGADLTKQLLALGKKRAQNRQIIDLNEAVGETYTLLKHALPSGIECVVYPAPTPTLIEIDPTELSRALLNMGVNARDAIEGEGRIELRVTTLSTSPSLHKRFPWLSQGPLACVSIRDTGVGMSAATRQRIFEPFFSTKGRRGGSGLGLAVVYKFIEESHGAIDVDSVEGQGTTFHIYLPLSEAAPLARELSPPSLPTEGLDVLLADGQSTVRDILGTLLGRHGYHVRAAQDHEALLKLVADDPPDVVLLDSALPKIGAFEAYRQLRARHPQLRVLILSGAATSPPNPPFGGWPPILLKPINVEQLVKTIERMGSPHIEEESTPTQVINVPTIP